MCTKETRKFPLFFFHFVYLAFLPFFVSFILFFFKTHLCRSYPLILFPKARATPSVASLYLYISVYIYKKVAQCSGFKIGCLYHSILLITSLASSHFAVSGKKFAHSFFFSSSSSKITTHRDKDKENWKRRRKKKTCRGWFFGPFIVLLFRVYRWKIHALFLLARKAWIERPREHVRGLQQKNSQVERTDWSLLPSGVN